jgi:hypothetical protein
MTAFNPELSYNARGAAWPTCGGRAGDVSPAGEPATPVCAMFLGMAIRGEQTYAGESIGMGPIGSGLLS